MVTLDPQRVIAVDFNGVLDNYTGWKGKNSEFTFEPRPGVADFLRAIKAMGYFPVVFTAANVDSVWSWLIFHNLDELVADVTNVKVAAIIYVDDRAIKFEGNFSDTLHQIANFRTFWELQGHKEGGYDHNNI